MPLDFHRDPRPFLAAAGELLAAQPVLGSVIATVSERAARVLETGEDPMAGHDLPFEPWWVVVRDEAGRAVSAAMRTAPFAPYPSFSLPMDDGSATELAAALHARGELLGGANGASPGSAVLAEQTARLWGGTAVTGKQTRLWECDEVTMPPAPPGRLRRATEDEAELLLAWFVAFHLEADEQAGREPDPASGEHVAIDDVLLRVREGVEWVWEDLDGDVVHMSGASLPSYGVSRVGPVYTPKPHRGRGIASYVVAELSRRGLVAGQRMCLFTDAANPTSNKVYEAVGYRTVAEMAEHKVVVPGS